MYGQWRMWWVCSCKRDYAGLLQRGRGGAVARRWPHEAKSTHTDRLWLCAASLMRLATSIQQVPKTAAKIYCTPLTKGEPRRVEARLDHRHERDRQHKQEDDGDPHRRRVQPAPELVRR